MEGEAQELLLHRAGVHAAAEVQPRADDTGRLTRSYWWNGDEREDASLGGDHRPTASWKLLNGLCVEGSEGPTLKLLPLSFKKDFVGPRIPAGE